MQNKKSAYIFIDAANLFYGGVKSLGWKIDYQKLIRYLKEKYAASKVFYYAGIEMHGFPYSILERKPIDLTRLLRYLIHLTKNKKVGEEDLMIIAKHIKRVKFYMKLEKFGYRLRLKPTKVFWNEGKPVKKANCDVDMTLDMVRYMEQYNDALVLSGDGDFAAVLQYLQSKKRNIFVLARGERSAREIRQIAGKNFRDFNYLREILKFEEI